jgi:hypothetical protein
MKLWLLSEFRSPELGRRVVGFKGPESSPDLICQVLQRLLTLNTQPLFACGFTEATTYCISSRIENCESFLPSKGFTLCKGERIRKRFSLDHNRKWQMQCIDFVSQSVWCLRIALII